MRRLLVTLASFACVLSASAQENAVRPIPWANKFFSGKTASPPPVILHDFGTLPQGTIKTHRFKMSNIYAVPMQVTVPNPSCRCVSILEYTGRMGPRETGYIDIQIDTSRVEGPRKIELRVKFEGRDPTTKNLFWSYAEVEIRAVSRPDISIKPGAIQFGTVPTGQKTDKAVTIVYSGRQRDWQISEFSGFNKSYLDVAVAKVNVRGGVAYQVAHDPQGQRAAGRRGRTDRSQNQRQGIAHINPQRPGNGAGSAHGGGNTTGQHSEDGRSRDRQEVGETRHHSRR